MTRFNKAGFPVDDWGHRTDRPYVHESGKKLWYPDELKYAQGERVIATGDYGLIHEGEAGTITGALIATSPTYVVLPDGIDKTQTVPEHLLQPE